MHEVGPRTCTLSRAARGSDEPCPRDRCPFWEPGGAVVAGGCAIERLVIDLRTPDLAAYLLDVRTQLEEFRANQY